MRSDSVKNMSAYADQNHAPSLAAARLEHSMEETKNSAKKVLHIIDVYDDCKSYTSIFCKNHLK